MASAAENEVSMNSSRIELCVKLWGSQRCDGSSSGRNWKLVDEGFLNTFVAQFEKVRQRTGIPEGEVLEAITSIKTAVADARKPGAKTEINLPTSGTSIPY